MVSKKKRKAAIIGTCYILAFLILLLANFFYDVAGIDYATFKLIIYGGTSLILLFILAYGYNLGKDGRMILYGALISLILGVVGTIFILKGSYWKFEFNPIKWVLEGVSLFLMLGGFKKVSK